MRAPRTTVGAGCAPRARRRRAPGAGSGPRPRSRGAAGPRSPARGRSARAPAGGRCGPPRTRRSTRRGRRRPSGRSPRSARGCARRTRPAHPRGLDQPRAAASGSPLAEDGAARPRGSPPPPRPAARMLPASTPPSTSIRVARPRAVDWRAQPADLVEARGEEALPAEAGVDGHDEHVVQLGQDLLEGGERRGGVQGHPALAPRACRGGPPRAAGGAAPPRAG